MTAQTPSSHHETSLQISALSLREKIHLMSGRYGWSAIVKDWVWYRHYNRRPVLAGGNARLGILGIAFCDGPRGVVSGHSTCFPVAIARGASFDVALEAEIGAAIASEVRAQGGNFYGGVCINLIRHPAGGRAQECFGEDSFHSGSMGAALVQGVQRHGVMACVKHFALNNQENTRFHIDIDCDERTLHEVYLPHFKMCVDAGAASVMTAYNRFRGTHLGHHAVMIQHILKQRWGFDGFVISDFIWGIYDTTAAANAGLDVEMCFTRHYGKRLEKAVAQGRVSAAQIDDSASRIARTVHRFAAMKTPYSDYSKHLIVCTAHQQLAQHSAEASMVLLKNEAHCLPLNLAQCKRIAVIGPLADANNLGDHGSSRVHPPHVMTILQGLRRQFEPSVVVDYVATFDHARAAKAVRQADYVIVVVGSSHRDEGEYIPAGPWSVGGDRRQLNLPRSQVNAIRLAAKNNPRTIAVLIGGSAFVVSDWVDCVPALIHAFYPGMMGGAALARMLCGVVNPSAKLPVTMAACASHYPHFDAKAKSCHYDYAHGYQLLENTGVQPLFAFGFGLSYTQFAFSHLEVAIDSVAQQIVIHVDISNVGAVAGSEVVQCYIGFEQCKQARIQKRLAAFAKVNLGVGQTQTVVLSVAWDQLCWYDEQTQTWQLESAPYTVYVGSSSRAEDLLKEVIQLQA